MKFVIRHLVLALAALLLAAAARAQHTYVVNVTPGAGVDFTTVQAAVDAAVDGDALLLVGNQSDTAVDIPGKRLVLAGVPGVGGALPNLQQLKIHDVPADKSIVLRRLAVSTAIAEKSLDVLDCAGPVLFEDCTIAAGVQFVSVVPTPTVAHSAHVMFTRCSLTGSMDLSAGAPGAGPGLLVDDSSVALYDCQVTGGAGASAIFLLDQIPQPATEGGIGVRVVSGTLFAAGCVVSGGAGGSGALQQVGGGCLAPANGGAGMELGSVLRRLDTAIAGGAAGAPATCGAAVAGQDLVLLGAGSVTVLPQTLRRLEISSPLEGGGQCTLTVHGMPGEMFVLLQSLAPLGSWLAGLKGTLAGAPPYGNLLLGPVGGDGTLVVSVLLPAHVLPVGVEAGLFVDQLVGKASSGGGLLSTPSAVLIVDDVP